MCAFYFFKKKTISNWIEIRRFFFSNGVRKQFYIPKKKHADLEGMWPSHLSSFSSSSSSFWVPPVLLVVVVMIRQEKKKFLVQLFAARNFLMWRRRLELEKRRKLSMPHGPRVDRGGGSSPLPSPVTQTQAWSEACVANQQSSTRARPVRYVCPSLWKFQIKNFFPVCLQSLLVILSRVATDKSANKFLFYLFNGINLWDLLISGEKLKNG